MVAAAAAQWASFTMILRTNRARSIFCRTYGARRRRRNSEYGISRLPKSARPQTISIGKSVSALCNAAGADCTRRFILGENRRARIVGRIDLLTDIKHELGHNARFDDLGMTLDSPMSAKLPTGIRRLPGMSDSDVIFANGIFTGRP